MATTPTHALPYPDDYLGPGDLPAWLKSLAEKADSELAKIAAVLLPSLFKRGEVTVTIPIGSANATVAVNFTGPALVAAPNVFTNPRLGASSGGYTSNIVAGATTSTVTVVAHRPAGASTAASAAVPVQWFAAAI